MLDTELCYVNPFLPVEGYDVQYKAEMHATLMKGSFDKLTWKMTLSLSSGAVTVLDTAPAAPPARRIRHQRPVCFSTSVNSSGTDKVSPMSINYKWIEDENNCIADGIIL